MGSAQRVLVFRTGQLGDTLVALPALHAIRRRFPEARLSLLTDRLRDHPGRMSSWTILGETGLFDEVHFYEPRRLSTHSLGTAWRLGARRYEHVYSLAPRRSAQQVRRDRFLLKALVRPAHYHDDAVPWRRGDPVADPEWLRLLRIVEPNARREDARAELLIPARAHAAADRELARRGISPQQPLIAIGAGSSMPAKRWPEESFAELGDALLRRHPQAVLAVVGAADERELGERLCARWAGRGHNLAGLDVYVSAAVLARSCVYVGNDNGAMHLAALAGTPCVAIFSARDAAGRWDPIGTGHVILREQPECSGCMLTVCTSEGNKCLTRIRVEAVLAATERTLGWTPG